MERRAIAACLVLAFRRWTMRRASQLLTSPPTRRVAGRLDLALVCLLARQTAARVPTCALVLLASTPPPPPSVFPFITCAPAPTTQLQVVHNSIANETYVLYQCGASPPPAANFQPGTKFFQARRLFCSVLYPTKGGAAAARRLPGCL